MFGFGQGTPRIAELERQPDGWIVFRLLATSLPTLKVDGWDLRLVSAVTAFVSGAHGPEERPEVCLEVRRGGRSVPLSLAPDRPGVALDLEVRLRYVLDGEEPGLPRQSSVYLAVRPAPAG